MDDPNQEQPTSDEPPHDPSGAVGFGLDGDEWVETARRAAGVRPPLGSLGPYELIEEIGRGGQGEVYKAVQPGTGRLIAVKRLAGVGFGGGPRRSGRFEREVEAVTRLSHPNIVTVHGAEVVGRHALLVMEMVDGKTLDRWADLAWASREAPLRRVLGVFAKVCDGVAHAHQRGVIHRDIKPSNILVDDRDEPRVLDFGIARLLGDHAAGAATDWTVTGFAGTPAYASPEQLRAGPEGVDTRTDVYSLGVLLYRVLTGRESVDPRLGIAAALESAATPLPLPSQARPGLPPECDWIVRKASDPEPTRRYQTVQALGEDVRRLIEGHPVHAAPPSRVYAAKRFVTRRPWLSAASGLAAATILGLGAVAAVQAVRLSARSAALGESLAAERAAHGEAEAARKVAQAERARAEEEATAQRATAGFLLTVLSGSSPNPGWIGFSRNRHALGALESLVADIGSVPSADVAAELRMRYGFALRAYGRHEEALANLRAARELALPIEGPAGYRPAVLTMQISISLRALGRAKEAAAECAEAIERAAAFPPTMKVHYMRAELALALASAGRPYPEFVEAAGSAIRHADTLPGVEYDRARFREEFAIVAADRGDYERALAWSREALEIVGPVRPDHAVTSRLNYLVATNLVALGRDEEAEPFARFVVADRMERDGADYGRTHRALRLYARILHRRGDFAEAAESWALAQVRPLIGGQSYPELPPLRLRRAAALFGAGNEAGARVTLAAALTGRTAADPADPALAEPIARVEAALNAGGWQIDDELRGRLGDQAWLLDGGTPPELPMPETNPEPGGA